MRITTFDVIGNVVALRKESVDRNYADMMALTAETVALRKESVDRNAVRFFVVVAHRHVALRKESVDRNVRHSCNCIYLGCRSPQGERG